MTTRRAFLATSASVAALGWQMPASAAGLNAGYDDAVWQALVRAIAGPVEVAPALLSALARDFAARFGPAAQDTLATHFGKAGIATVLDPQADAATEDQVQWIALYLFTGSANPADDAAPMANYVHALGWKSLRFAKAPGLCSGPEFGYWLEPWGAA